MRRKLFSLASAVSLFLCVTTALLLERSANYPYSALFTKPTTTLRWIVLRPARLMVISVGGWPRSEPLRVFSAPADSPPIGPFLRWAPGYAWDSLGDGWRLRTATGIVQIEGRPPNLPFGRADVRRGTNGAYTTCKVVQIPLIPLLAAFSFLPMLWLLNFIHKRRIGQSRRLHGWSLPTDAVNA